MDAKSLLLESFDRQLSVAEQSFLDQALAQNADLRAEKQQLQAIRNSLSQLKVTPRIGFADSVMNKLDVKRPSGFIYQMTRLFPQVVAASILVAMLSLFSTYWSTGSLDTDSLIGYQDLQPEEAVYVLEE